MKKPKIIPSFGANRRVYPRVDSVKNTKEAYEKMIDELLKSYKYHNNFCNNTGDEYHCERSEEIRNALKKAGVTFDEETHKKIEE